MKALTVLVDMDDTLENLCEKWVEYLNHKHGTSVDYGEVDDWDMSKAFPTLNRELVYARCRIQRFWRVLRRFLEPSRMYAGYLMTGIKSW